MRKSLALKDSFFIATVILLAMLLAPEGRAQMDWAELEADSSTASQEHAHRQAAALESYIENGEYVRAVEFAYGHAGPLPKKYRKMAVDNAIGEIRKRYDSGQRAEATLEIMDLAIRFSQVKVLKRARNHFFYLMVKDWQAGLHDGELVVNAQEDSNGNMCVLARGLASWGRRNFKKRPEMGLDGLELAHLYCPNGADITYNLGLAQYKAGNKENALETWKSLTAPHPNDVMLMSNIGWLCLELGKVDLADHYAMLTLTAEPSDSNGLAIRLEVLFSRGQYREAAQLVFANERQVPPHYEGRAVEYAASFAWEIFHSGKKEKALAYLEGLANDFPQGESFSPALATMQAALSGQATDVSMPGALPHHRPQGVPILPPDYGGDYRPHTIGQGAGFTRDNDSAFALVVGVHKYKHMVGPRYAEKDALLFHDLLTGYMGFSDDRSNIRMHTGERALSRTVKEGVKWLARQADFNPEALIIMYFSGKGAPVYGDDGSTVEDCLILPYDADPDHPENGKPVALSEISRAFSDVDNPHVLVIIDAGFFGDGKSIGLGHEITPKPASNLFKSKATIVTAANIDMEALEFHPGKQGAFTYFFLEALTGDGDVDRNGWVDSWEAYVWTSGQMDKLGIVQHPSMNRMKAINLSKVR